jgi:hypothetical protein
MTKVQLYFGWDCGMMEFLRAAIQRTIDMSPGSAKKIMV